MAVSFTEVMEVKNFLMQQHINVSSEWTKACIEFVKQEKGSSLPLQNVKKVVQQQWLVADLEEIACSSLPQDLPTVQKITLNNSFALQVQGIRDISRPAYSQLKQLEGTVNSNAEFSAAPKEAVPEWEAKPTRMLMLNLTDGCTYIQGMEYRIINFLSPNLHPGIKVLIKGPVECRFGVLLLTPDNIRILGGEVESKLQKYSRENLLREQLQLPTDGNNEEAPTGNLNVTNNTQDLSNSYRSSNLNSQPNVIQRNQINSLASHQATVPAENRDNEDDILENFDSDDDFVQNIDYGKIDEIESTQGQHQESTIPDAHDECDLWQEDEDVVRDMFEFQDRNPGFEMPFDLPEESSSRGRKEQGYQNNTVFTYLSSVLNEPSSDCVITIKGFIITVLSKLECTPKTGWNLMVKINDGTATVDANIHDKVLENIIGVSAQDMMKKQVQAAQNPQIRREVMEAISKCKLTLQNYNCLMDVKFTPGDKPCIIKCSPVSQLQIQQMLERVRSSYESY